MATEYVFCSKENYNWKKYINRFWSRELGFGIDFMFCFVFSVYVTEAVLLKLLLKFCNTSRHTAKQPFVDKMLTLMWTCLEEEEITVALKNLFLMILTSYRFSQVTRLPSWFLILSHLILFVQLVQCAPVIRSADTKSSRYFQCKQCFVAMLRIMFITCFGYNNVISTLPGPFLYPHHVVFRNAV